MAASTLWKTILGLWVVALLSIAVFARAQDEAAGDEEADGEDAASGDAPADGAQGEKPLGFGLSAITYFPKNTELKAPAGEKVETLILLSNVAANPEYQAVFVAAHLSPLGDHSKYYQNFSGNAYKRALVAGESTTLKYSFTPDVNAEPMEFALVVRVFIQPTADPNSTFALSAFNASLTLTEPLGTDPKSVFTVLWIGAIAAAVFYWYSNKSSSSSTGASSSKAAAAPRVVNEIQVSRTVTVDADFLPKDHLKHVQKLSQRGRSGSPKN